MKSILSVRNLKTSFDTKKGEIEAVRGVSFDVKNGEIIGVVGESGSGKSVMSKSILRLIKSPGVIKAGSVKLHDEDLLQTSEEAFRAFRGKKISMVFQDPMTSLNPVYTVGRQLRDVIRLHMGLSKKEAKWVAVEKLREVGIPNPEIRYNSYPHEFSGGMRQRALIAMAIACEPDILIADEPTTALDVTIQAQIIELLKQIRDEKGTTILFITHDLGVVSEICSRVMVMYGGLIMEEGPVKDIFSEPRHPYTQGLLRSIPRLDLGRSQKLVPIEGTVPSLLNPPKGCPFASRCVHKVEKCQGHLPPQFECGDAHNTRCWLMGGENLCEGGEFNETAG